MYSHDSELVTILSSEIKRLLARLNEVKSANAILRERLAHANALNAKQSELLREALAKDGDHVAR